MSDEPHDRDERFTMYDADPEEVLRALLQVDPDADPVVDEGPEGDDTVERFGPRQQWEARGRGEGESSEGGAAE